MKIQKIKTKRSKQCSLWKDFTPIEDLGPKAKSSYIKILKRERNKPQAKKEAKKAGFGAESERALPS